jgi:hypothetical protein
MYGDETKEMQRIAEVIVKERLICAPVSLAGTCPKVFSTYLLLSRQLLLWDSEEVLGREAPQCALVPFIIDRFAPAFYLSHSVSESEILRAPVMH